MSYSGDGAYIAVLCILLGYLAGEFLDKFSYHKIPRAKTKDKDRELRKRVNELREEFED